MSIHLYRSSILVRRRQWHPTPVLLPGKSHEWRSLVGCSPWVLARLSDLTFAVHFHALEKEMATHSSTLAWKIPWMEEPGRLQSMRSQSWTWLSDFPFNFHFSLLCIGEGNGNPLKYPCLEISRDGGAWWAAVYGVAQSLTRLKRLISSIMSYCFSFLKIQTDQTIKQLFL